MDADGECSVGHGQSVVIFFWSSFVVEWGLLRSVDDRESRLPLGLHAYTLTQPHTHTQRPLTHTVHTQRNKYRQTHLTHARARDRTETNRMASSSFHFLWFSVWFSHPKTSPSIPGCIVRFRLSVLHSINRLLEPSTIENPIAHSH